MKNESMTYWRRNYPKVNDFQKVYNLIGLACKGGNLVAGTEKCKKAVLSNSAKLVLLSTDCSDNTRKLFNDKCLYRDIPIAIFGTKDRLGKAVGKDYRTVLAILNEGFSREIMKLIGS